MQKLRIQLNADRRNINYARDNHVSADMVSRIVVNSALRLIEAIDAHDPDLSDDAEANLRWAVRVYREKSLPPGHPAGG